MLKNERNRTTVKQNKTKHDKKKIKERGERNKEVKVTRKGNCK